MITKTAHLGEPPAAAAPAHPDARLIDLWSKFEPLADECDELAQRLLDIDNGVAAFQKILPPDEFKRLEGVQQRSDYVSLIMQQSDLNARASAIGVEIMNIHAETLRGVGIKADVAFWCQGGFEAWDRHQLNNQNMLQSLMENLLSIGVLEKYNPRFFWRDGESRNKRAGSK
jgi:hypothetical protein